MVGLLVLLLLHLLECSCGHLLINHPSSGLLQGTLLHTFEPTSLYHLIHHPQDCPADTFALAPGELAMQRQLWDSI